MMNLVLGEKKKITEKYFKINNKNILSPKLSQLV